METCAICEREVISSRIKEVVSGKGVIKVCDICYTEEMPLFVKPSPEDFANAYNRRKPVYTRLSEAAGLNPEEHRKRISDFGKKSGVVKDDSLRKIVKKGYEEKAKVIPKNDDLIDNFHWVIMRARRAKKLTQAQFAAEIKETEASIVMAEKGIISPGNDLLVRKLENALRIRISKKSPYDLDSDAVKRELLGRIENGTFDPSTNSELNVSDLNEKPKRKWWQFGKKKEKKAEEEKVEEEIEEIAEEE